MKAPLPHLTAATLRLRVYDTPRRGISSALEFRNMGVMMQDIEQILGFWFEESTDKERFGKDPAFDANIRRRFGTQVEEAMKGGLTEWCDSPAGTLAYIILLDQFTRNIFRGSPRAFAADHLARAAAVEAIDAGLDAGLEDDRKTFLYLPLEHSEDLEDQERCVALFEAMGDAEKTDYAVRHRDIIKRFGRFPHRNETLGRESTDAELAFLKEPGSSF